MNKVRSGRGVERLAFALVAAQAAWAAAGFVFPSLPGWVMFSRAEPVRARLADRDGISEDLFAFVPRDVYVVNRDGAREVAAFVCRSRPERAPWKLVWTDDGSAEAACRP